MEYHTNSNGQVIIEGVFDGTCIPTMHPAGYTMAESEFGPYLDLYELFSVTKDVYVDMPDADELEFVDHTLKLCNYRLGKDRDIDEKSKCIFQHYNTQWS